MIDESLANEQAALQSVYSSLLHPVLWNQDANDENAYLQAQKQDFRNQQLTSL